MPIEQTREVAQLRAYREQEGAPFQRWGRSIVCVPESLGTWLMAREKHQIARRAARLGK